MTEWSAVEASGLVTRNQKVWALHGKQASSAHRHVRQCAVETCQTNSHDGLESGGSPHGE